MDEQIAPGLTADWLNAWLAAIGATVLVPGLHLGWTEDPIPKARFSLPDGEVGEKALAELIAGHLPMEEQLEELVISGLPLNVPVELFRQTAKSARERRDQSLALLTTDVCGSVGKNGELPKVPFNVGAPRGETLYTRLRTCRQKLDGKRPLTQLVEASLAGRGVRFPVNGLGFDYRRIAASVPGEAEKLADPVIECLCFFGLLLHPVGGRGNGTRPIQRGWAAPPNQRHAFQWPVWSDQLDRWAIDGLLDVVYRDTVGSWRASPLRSGHKARLEDSWRRLGVTGLYGTVPFQQVGSSDTTRGYASERLA